MQITIIYPLPEILPDSRARFLQIVNTCYALAEAGIRVLLVAGIKRGYSREKLLNYYGLLDNPNLIFIHLPILRRENKRYFKLSSNGVFYFSFLLYILIKRSYLNAQTFLYLRHIKLAHFLIRFKRILKLPLIFEIHEVFYVNISNSRKREKIRSIESSIYQNVDIVISISNFLKEYLVNKLGIKNRIYVIQNSFRREWLQKDRESGEYICYTGGLYFWKGIDTLIKAMKYLPKEKLVIVGGGDRLDELKQLTLKEGVHNRVTFVGPVPHSNVPEYLSRAKVAVIPNAPTGQSYFSSPLKLFEYMAYGIPIIVSKMPVFREILEDGRNALFFESGSPESLAKSIKRLIDDPELASRLAATSKEDAKSYTYQKRAKKIINVIKSYEYIKENIL